MSGKNNQSGLILLNKQAGITSFDALGEIKRSLGTGKVGHTGTLDKFAQGLLLVLTGRALKLSNWFLHCDKQYEATIHFGIETETLDPEGKPVACAPVPSLSEIQAALPQFAGQIMQSPPAYSAIHINGQRASALARAGHEPEMEKRPVHIYRIDLLDWQPPLARIFVHCSSGTYIRSLARDIALAAGSRAHLCALVRTQVAGFELGNGQLLEKTSRKGAEAQRTQREEEREISLKSMLVTNTTNLQTETSFLISHSSFLPLPINKSIFRLLGIPWFELEPEKREHIMHGKPLADVLKGKQLVQHGLYVPPGGSVSGTAGVFCAEKLAAVIEEKGEAWKYGCVYADS